MSALEATYLSFDRFLSDPSIEEHSEWVDGKVVPMHAVQEPHDRLVHWLHRVLGTYVEHARLGRVLGEPFLVKLPGQPAARAPDLFFVKNDRLNRIRRRYLDGPADLIVEVVSADSHNRDRVHKLAEYELAGVPEYWILAPDRQQATFYRLGDDGRYARAEPEAGVYRTEQLPDAELTVQWMWRSEPPTAVEVLRGWGVL